MRHTWTERGASMVEAAIALPLFLVVVFATTEILWYYHVRISLEYAAQQGADMAAKQPLELIIESKECQSKPDDCQQFKKAFEAVVERTVSNALMVAKPSTGQGSVKLVRFSHYNQGDYKPSVWDGMKNYEAEVAVVRPGEAVRYEGSKKWNHPFRPSSTQSTIGVGWPSADVNGENWHDVLMEHPIAVHLEAIYTPITPLLSVITGPLRISVTQFGYRNTGQRGIAAPYAKSQPTPGTPGNNPSPTPTKTPNVAQGTPTPGKTPTPKPTKTPHPCQNKPNPCQSNFKACCPPRSCQCADYYDCPNDMAACSSM